MPHHRKFDTLRGVAALVVFLSHVYELYWQRLLGEAAPLSRFWATAGRHAVLVFFLLSGYLIMLSIHDNARRNAGFSAPEYLASRIARIHPPLVGALGIMALVWLAIHLGDLPGKTDYGLPGDLYVMRPRYDIPLSRIATSLLMLGGLTGPNPVLWSLYFEFQLYVLALLVTLGLTAHGGALRGACLVAAALGIAVLTAHDAAFLFYALVWLIGAAAALGTLRGGAAIERRLRAPALGLACVLAALGILQPGALAATGAHPDYAAQLAFCVPYAYLIFFFPGLDGILPAPLARTGDFSYSLYVVHFPLLFLLLSLGQDWMQHSYARTAALSALAVAAIVPLAYAFARVFERPKKFRAALLAAFDGLKPGHA